jgi:hypothetical protein
MLTFWLIDQFIVEIKVNLSFYAPRRSRTELDFLIFGFIWVLAILGINLNSFDFDVHLEVSNIVLCINICLLDDLSVLVELNLMLTGISPFG